MEENNFLKIDFDSSSLTAANISEEQFEELVEGIKELKFDRLGAFTYSPEENTKSYDFDGQLDEDTKQKRLKILMDAQKEISLEKNKERLGKTYEVIVEDIEATEHLAYVREVKVTPTSYGGGIRYCL